MGKKLLFFFVVILGQLTLTRYFFPNIILLVIYLIWNTLWEAEKKFTTTIFFNFFTILISNLLIREINLDGHGESLWFAINLLTIIIGNILMTVKCWQKRESFWMHLLLIGILSVIILLVDVKLVIDN
jgi:hypothetical protein